MLRDEVKKAVDRFSDAVIKQAKRNLTIMSINSVRKSLWKSLKRKIKEDRDSIDLTFTMNEYGLYIDRGVQGVESRKRVRGEAKPFGNNAIESYRFRNKMPPARAFKEDKLGRPVEDSIQYAIARSIYRKGVPETGWFSRPFASAFSKLPEELQRAYKIDIEGYIDDKLNAGN